MTLWELLWPGDAPVVTACVGAGGKTTLLERLGREAATMNRDLLLTVTTHWGEPPAIPRGTHIQIPAGASLPARVPGGVLLLSGPPLRAEARIGGVTPARLAHLPAGYPRAVVIEADGSRRRAVKAPGDHEPVLPRNTTLAVCVTGFAILNAPVTPDNVHRWERFSEITGVVAGDRFTPQVAARLLGHRRGAFSGTEGAVRRIWIVNGADSADQVAEARRFLAAVGEAISASGAYLPVDTIAVASLQSDDPVRYSGTGWNAHTSLQKPHASNQ